jgi:phosphatidylglycerophosphatase A
MRPRLSRWIALGAGSGLAPVAPGTAGTLLAWLLYSLGLSRLSEPAQVAVVAVGFIIGIWASEVTARDLGVADHGSIVWDEIIAFWLVLLFVPAGFGSQFVAFLLFRFFDIAKPPPIRHFDRTIKNGFGVMLDDLIAAFYTLLLFAFWKAG